jgi:hypothetical protein
VAGREAGKFNGGTDDLNSGDSNCSDVRRSGRILGGVEYSSEREEGAVMADVRAPLGRRGVREGPVFGLRRGV